MLDVIVIGAGINGTWTAYHLAKRGYKTLLIDQFPLPHTRGSSHGQTRGIRKAYPEPFLTKMMNDAYEQWHQLEKFNHAKLFKPTGLLTMGERNENYFSRVVKSFQANQDLDFELYDPEEMKAKFPMLEMGPEVWGCYDPSAGILMADKCLAILWENYQRYGGTILENITVQKIVPGIDKVQVFLDDSRRFESKSIVVCAGPWTSKIMEPLGWKLPLTPIKVSVFYYKSSGHIPHNFYYQDKSIKVWGTAQHEYNGLNKVCLSTGPPVDPDNRDAIDISEVKEKLRNFISKKFLKVDPSPAIEESCIYTVSPDLRHILDRHPKYPNIVVGCGFSGSGFKMGPISGEILADLATNTQSKYNLAPFRASRFKPTSSL